VSYDDTMSDRAKEESDMPQTPNAPASDAETIRTDFERDGYHLARGLFDPDAVAELAAEFARIVARLEDSGDGIDAGWQTAKALAPGTRVVHTHQVQCYSARWAQALFAPRLLDVAAAILGPDVTLHHSKLFQKPPHTGAPFPMHQDWSYFPFKRDSMIAAIIHLTPATDAMGCLRVVPGSHRLGRVHGSGGQGDGSDPRWQAFHAEHGFQRSIPLEAEAGDVAFFHYCTVHGSKPNTSVHTRKTVLFQLHAGGDEPEGDHRHPYSALALRGFNHTAGRRFAARHG